MPRRDVVFDKHWRWRSAEPTVDELLVLTMSDGSLPIPATWRLPVQEHQAKKAECSVAPAQIEPAAADQGGPPGGEAHTEAEPQHHDDMPVLVDSSDDKDSDDDEVSDQGGPVLIGQKPLERAPQRTPLAATQAAAWPAPGLTPTPTTDVSAPCSALDQGRPLWCSPQLQLSHGSANPAQASEQLTLTVPSDMLKSSPVSVAPSEQVLGTNQSTTAPCWCPRCLQSCCCAHVCMVCRRNACMAATTTVAQTGACISSLLQHATTAGPAIMVRCTWTASSAAHLTSSSMRARGTCVLASDQAAQLWLQQKDGEGCLSTTAGRHVDGPAAVQHRQGGQCAYAE